jgi:ABC-type multidrug transport system ATPase subunit
VEIQCRDISKHFKRERLFKKFDYTFQSPGKYAILGPNSSGKSTLMKILAGNLDANGGKVEWSIEERNIERELLFQYVSFTAPYVDLPEDFSVMEILRFHFSLKTAKCSEEEFMEIAGLGAFRDKSYRDLSSGLKNKLKLSLAVLSEAEVYFLDEPCTNFDEANVIWYQNLVQEYCDRQMLIIASNDPREYDFCEREIRLMDYKQ